MHRINGCGKQRFGSAKLCSASLRSRYAIQKREINRYRNSYVRRRLWKRMGITFAIHKHFAVLPKTNPYVVSLYVFSPVVIIPFVVVSGV